MAFRAWQEGMRGKDTFLGMLRPNLADTDGLGSGSGRLAGVQGEREFAEERLKRPAGGEMDADAAPGLAHTGTGFEEACTQSLDLRRAPRLREQQQTKQVDQVVGEAVQQQTEGIGQKAMAA